MHTLRATAKEENLEPIGYIPGNYPC
jgi:hypothetical protein